jgi:hypothetical protein
MAKMLVRTTAGGLLGGLTAAIAGLAALSVIVGGDDASDAVESAFYACVLATSGAVAFGLSRRGGATAGTAWMATALAIGTMVVVIAALYVSYFEFVLDGGFGDL